MKEGSAQELTEEEKNSKIYRKLRRGRLIRKVSGSGRAAGNDVKRQDEQKNRLAGGIQYE